MAKRPMTTTERVDILAIKASLNTAKDALKAAMASCVNIMDRAEAGGETAEFNAAYRAKENFRACLAQIGIAHADASIAMDAAVEAAAEIFGGGGGRR